MAQINLILQITWTVKKMDKYGVYNAYTWTDKILKN